MRKQVPPEKTAAVLEFATKKPEARLASIINGLKVLEYGQSEYLRSFGLSVDASGPVKITARVLKPPSLIYGAGSRQPTVVRSFSFFGHFISLIFVIDPSWRRMEHDRQKALQACLYSALDRRHLREEAALL